MFHDIFVHRIRAQGTQNDDELYVPVLHSMRVQKPSKWPTLTNWDDPPGRVDERTNHLSPITSKEHENATVKFNVCSFEHFDDE